MALRDRPARERPHIEPNALKIFAGSRRYPTPEGNVHRGAGQELQRFRVRSHRGWSTPKSAMPSSRAISISVMSDLAASPPMKSMPNSSWCQRRICAGSHARLREEDPADVLREIDGAGIGDREPVLRPWKLGSGSSSEPFMTVMSRCTSRSDTWRRAPGGRVQYSPRPAPPAATAKCSRTAGPGGSQIGLATLSWRRPAEAPWIAHVPSRTEARSVRDISRPCTVGPVWRART